MALLSSSSTVMISIWINSHLLFFNFFKNFKWLEFLKFDIRIWMEMANYHILNLPNWSMHLAIKWLLSRSKQFTVSLRSVLACLFVYFWIIGTWRTFVCKTDGRSFQASRQEWWWCSWFGWVSNTDSCSTRKVLTLCCFICHLFLAIGGFKFNCQNCQSMNK